jgi:hypothetical protein
MAWSTPALEWAILLLSGNTIALTPTPPRLLQVSVLGQPEMNASAGVSLRDCWKGEVVGFLDSITEFCRTCPYGSFSFNPREKFCRACPPGMALPLVLRNG